MKQKNCGFADGKYLSYSSQLNIEHIHYIFIYANHPYRIAEVS